MQTTLKLVIPCVVLNTETKEYHVDPPALGTTTIFADGALLRLEINSISSAEDGLVIFRGDRNEMIVADNERLEYYIIDEQALKQMAAQVGDAMHEMQDMLESLPPEERAEAETMMQQQMPEMREAPTAPSTLMKTGESDTINGYRCQYYEVVQADRKKRDMCVAAWGDIEGGGEAAEAMTGIGGFFKRMHDVFSESSGADLMGSQAEIFAQMKELGGYPIYARDYDETGALEGESILRSSREESIDPTMFKIPEGYRRGDMY
jgi:hypothetical protein